MDILREKGYHEERFYEILEKINNIRNHIAHPRPLGSRELPLSEVVEVVNSLDDIIRIMLIGEES